MKNVFCFAIGTIFVMTFSAVYASPLPECKFGKETLNEVTCYGPAELVQTTISGGVMIAGPLEARNTVMASMNVVGLANLKDSDVKANVTVSGNLISKNGQFDGDLNITSDKALLNNSTIKGSITISSAKTKDETKDEANEVKDEIKEQPAPILELICGTRIQGNVNFLDKQGVVKKTKDSIIEGKIINGIVEQITTTEKCPPSASSLLVLPVFCSIRHENDVVGALVDKCSGNITVASKKMRSYHL